MVNKLTNEQIKALASRKGVKKTAVENFLMSMPLDIGYIGNDLNLAMDAKAYSWNRQTIEAIRKGLSLAFH